MHNVLNAFRAAGFIRSMLVWNITAPADPPFPAFLPSFAPNQNF